MVVFVEGFDCSSLLEIQARVVERYLAFAYRVKKPLRAETVLVFTQYFFSTFGLILNKLSKMGNQISTIPLTASLRLAKDQALAIALNSLF